MVELYQEAIIGGIPMWYCTAHRYYFPKHLACPVCSPMVMGLVQDQVRWEAQKLMKAAMDPKKEN